MQIMETLGFGGFSDTFVKLLVAFILGTIIGAERQYRQRTAGLRTNVLVAIGACQFVALTVDLAGAAGAARVISTVVSGIGFLGAGVIMKDGLNVRGLNTAATLWCSAAAGASIGAGLMPQGVLFTVFIIGGNTLLRPLVNAINRTPVSEGSSEATYEVRVMTTMDQMSHAREHVQESIEAAHYPVSDIQIIDRPGNVVDLVATLVSTSINPNELDAVVAALHKLDCVTSAAWSSRTIV